MTHELIVSGVWPAVKSAAATAGPRHAAIAFIGVDAPDLLYRFGSRDILVVNAGDDSLRAHATNPTALRAFVTKGVSVWSVTNLHAKVIATGGRAVVGSANASHSSELSQEAVMISTQKSTISGIVDFVSALVEVATPVDSDFIERAQEVWDSVPAPKRRVPGVNGEPRRPPLRPAQIREMSLDYYSYKTYNASEKAAQKKGFEAARKLLDNVDAYRLDAWRAPGYEAGNVVMLHNSRSVWPAAVVVAVTPITGVRNDKMLTLRYEKNARPLSLKRATTLLQERGIVNFSWDEDRWIGDRKIIRALLGLWD